MRSMSADDLSTLISRIYDCALQPDLWSDALTRLTVTLDAGFSAIVLADNTDPANPSGVFAATSPWDTQQLAWMDKYIPEVPGTLAMFRGDLDVPYATLSLVPEEEFQRTNFYREWAAPQGLRDGCVTKFSSNNARVGVFTFSTSARRDIIGPDELALSAIISPHVRRAALIGELFNSFKSAAANYRSALDALATPVFLTDRAGHIHFRNAAAEAMLERDKGGKLDRRSVMTAVTLAAREPLADAIARAAVVDLATLGGRGIGIPLSAAGEPPMAGYVLPLSNSEVRGSFGSAEVAVFVSSASQHMALPEAMLLGLFDLTPSEARVMLRVGAGARPADVGTALGISENTVKTHLARIFAKTKTSRQPQLTALLGSLMRP